MKLLHTSALVLLAGLSAANAFAKSDNVTYGCQNGRNVTVNYHFNDAGVPTKAIVTLKGEKRTLNYDMARSDDVGTFFKDARGYNLGADYMDANNYRQAAVLITAPDGNILYKACSPQAPKAQKKSPKNKKKGNDSKQVSYQCQNDRRLNVRYRFNEQGIPVSATATLNGKARRLSYDLGKSTDVETFFTGQGYRISSDYMDADNYRGLALIVTGPNDDILYKSCMPN